MLIIDDDNVVDTDALIANDLREYSAESIDLSKQIVHLDNQLSDIDLVRQQIVNSKTVSVQTIVSLEDYSGEPSPIERGSVTRIPSSVNYDKVYNYTLSLEGMFLLKLTAVVFAAIWTVVKLIKLVALKWARSEKAIEATYYSTKELGDRLRQQDSMEILGRRTLQELEGFVNERLLKPRGFEPIDLTDDIKDSGNLIAQSIYYGGLRTALSPTFQYILEHRKVNEGIFSLFENISIVLNELIDQTNLICIAVTSWQEGEQVNPNDIITSNLNWWIPKDFSFDEPIKYQLNEKSDYVKLLADSDKLRVSTLSLVNSDFVYQFMDRHIDGKVYDYQLIFPRRFNLSLLFETISSLKSSKKSCESRLGEAQRHSNLLQQRFNQLSEEDQAQVSQLIQSVEMISYHWRIFGNVFHSCLNIIASVKGYYSSYALALTTQNAFYRFVNGNV